MALRRKDTEPDVPGTSKVTYCKRDSGGKECGLEALHTVSGTIEVMGKSVNVKIPVCDKHMRQLGGLELKVNLKKDEGKK